MVKHIVMYRLKERTEENATALKDKFLSMKGKIDVLKDIQAGVDTLKSQRSFDVVLECTFDTLADLETYKNDEVHIPVMKYVQSVVEVSHSVDYIY
ncbi:MAG: Dabb family protein [Clostridia bacterium]|nr:Dabb family protein [Clostridia bacterium]MDE7329434.1 Dabb family protein [Clostridia bacterium]